MANLRVPLVACHCVFCAKTSREWQIGHQRNLVPPTLCCQWPRDLLFHHPCAYAPPTRPNILMQAKLARLQTDPNAQWSMRATAAVTLRCIPNSPVTDIDDFRHTPEVFGSEYLMGHAHAGAREPGGAYAEAACIGRRLAYGVISIIDALLRYSHT